MVNNFTLMSVHVGQLIKKIIEQKSFIKSEMATKMGLTNSSLHKILNKKDINTDQLRRFSELLSYNFFEELAGDLKYSSNSHYQQLIANGEATATSTAKQIEDWRSKYYSSLDDYRELNKKYIAAQDLINSGKQEDTFRLLLAKQDAVLEQLALNSIATQEIHAALGNKKGAKKETAI